MKAIWKQLVQRSPVLSRLALMHALLLVVLLMLGFMDSRQLGGEGIWEKPAKFAGSISIYLASMAWLLAEMRSFRALVRIIGLVVGTSMLLEQVLITFQAARGVSSHYNEATAFDSAIFSLMGFGVAANSAAVALAWLLLMGLRDRQRAGYIAGIRWGLALFLLGSLQGFLMILNSGHTVGAADGGPGVPLTGWNTAAGDLRVAHFVGIHALQVLPLIGWLIDRSTSSPAFRRRMVVALIATMYAGIGAVALVSALQGQPWPFSRPLEFAALSSVWPDPGCALS